MEAPENLEFYERLTLVTTPRQRPYGYYEIRRALGVGGNRYLESLTSLVGDAKTAGAVSQSLNEGVDILHSTGRVTDEQIFITPTDAELDFTGIGLGVDQGGQENDSNGKSAIEDHHVERRVKARHWLPLNTQLFIYGTPGGLLIDQMVPRWDLHFLVGIKMRQEVTR